MRPSYDELRAIACSYLDIHPDTKAPLAELAGLLQARLNSIGANTPASHFMVEFAEYIDRHRAPPIEATDDKGE